MEYVLNIFINRHTYRPFEVPVVKIVKLISGGEISYTMKFANGKSISHTEFIRLNRIFID